MSDYEAILDGGGPWGIRLQGGKDFGVPLNVARVTPGSKAGNKGIMAGDTILVINGNETENLTHMDAQNLIKNAGSRLHLKLKAGKGVSLGEVKQVGSGGFAAQPSKTLYTTDVTHSAGVDHKYNSKPRAFGAAPAGGSTTQVKKFDPAEYARKKKEELDKYKEDQKKPAVAPDSDVLRMLQNTSVNDKQSNSGSFSRLQRQLSNEGEWADQEKSFRMTAEGTDLVDVSPGSRAVMDDIRNRGTAGLSSSGSASGGSKSFKFLQQMTDQDEESKSQCSAGDAEPVFSMMSPNPHHAPLKAVKSNPNPIMDSLMSKMKEMNIDKEKLDRTSSISTKDRKRGRYLSNSSYESAERPRSPRPASPISPTTPVFKMTMAKGAYPGQDAFGSNNVIASLQNQLNSDKMTLGLKQTRGSPRSPALRHMQKSFTKKDQDLPPPPPELMGVQEPGYNQGSFGQSGPSSQSNTFRRLQQHVDDGTGDQVQTVFGQPKGQRGQAVPAQPSVHTQRNTATSVNSLPKAPAPSGPNFKVGRVSAPTFKPNPVASYSQPKPAPPAVNAGEVVNPHSRQFNPHSNPPSQLYSSPQSPSYTPPGRMPPTSPPVGPPPTPPGSANIIKTKSSPQPVPSPNGDKELFCHACQQPLTGPFVSAIGKTWHPQHFCCSACNVSLQNQAFVEENNQLFCEKCYNQYYAPKCAHCNSAIIGNCINALGKSWHPDHFVCSFCNRGFGNDGFLVDSGKPYCETCFEDLFSVKCGKCARAITGGEKYVEALNKNWHSDCFTCNVCSIRLEGNSFFVSRGMPYCQTHKSGH